MGNTRLDPVLGLYENYDIASARVQLLRELGIDFSEAFPDLSSWDFDTLNTSWVKNCPPRFQNGIIFSSLIPKSVTQHELFKKIRVYPKRIVFIDDTLRHLEDMLKTMTELKIDCFCFHYTQKTCIPLVSYFSPSCLITERKYLEAFLAALYDKKDLSVFYGEIHLKRFIIHMHIDQHWRLWR